MQVGKCQPALLLLAYFSRALNIANSQVNVENSQNLYNYIAKTVRFNKLKDKNQY